MRKHYILPALLFCSFFIANAGNVTVADAQKVAINFFQLNVPAAGRDNITATLNYTRTEADNTVDFYAFDMSPVKGFVIVSANDNLMPVLAYSTESYFNANLNQTGLKDWMSHAGQQIYGAIQQHALADTKISGLWTAYRSGQNPGSAKSGTVGPLVTTTWNQEPYYNNLCPFNSVDNERCVTGCVATTMGQIMKYWNYPPQGLGSYSYNDNYSYGYGVQSANFGATTYNWTAMPAAVTSNSNASAVATLLYQCGVSVAMDYGDDNEDGSGAAVMASQSGSNKGQSAQNAFTTYFGYANTIQAVLEAGNTTSQWVNTIEAEINAGRPVEYEGWDEAYGGHTWVCDGYEANNMLHMNWGWGGTSDGYFLVSNLSVLTYNFSNQEGALIGIEPVQAGVQVTAQQSSFCLGDTTILSAIATTQTYKWTPTTGLSCPTCAFTQAYPASTTTYTVRIDSSGVVGIGTITVTVDPKIIVANKAVTNATCYGLPDGAAGIAVSGGTPTFSYFWSNASTGAKDSDLVAGTYGVTVRDAAGCSATGSQTITQPSEIKVTSHSNNAGCTASTGSASVTVTGGSGSGYTYRWSTGATSTSITGVAAGNYNITVTDSHSCITVTDIVVNQPYLITFSTDAIPSNGSNGSALVADVTGGTSPYSYEWNTGATSPSINGLAAGDYTVTVSDQNGCKEIASIEISSTTGIGNIDDAVSFNLYPNPAQNYVMLQVSQVENGTMLYMENVLGQTLFAKPLTEMQTQLDLSNFAAGVYFIELRAGEKRAVKQIIISR